MRASIGWYNVLRGLGYEVVVEPGGDLTFTDQGVRFRCMPEEHDETYLHIVLPGVWSDTTDNPGLRARASEIIHTLNATVKVAKLILSGSSVYVSVESISPSHAVGARQIPDLLTCAKLAGMMFDEAFFKTDSKADQDEGDDEDEPPAQWRG